MKIGVAKITIDNPTVDIDEEILQSLQDSMAEKGLSHPIKVRQANDFFILASGEKRLHCSSSRLGWDADRSRHRRRGLLTARVELRIHENIKRFNSAVVGSGRTGRTAT
jgi:hypothetical protein